jgi:hypothetical protein
MRNILHFLRRFLLSFDIRTRLFFLVVLLGFFMFFATSLPFITTWYIVLPILILLTYIVVYIGIFTGIERVEWVTLFFVPILFIISMYLFYYLVPGRLLTRLPFTLICCVGLYSTVLASNIFNVAKEKNIQLQRAAFAINYLVQIISYYLLLVALLGTLGNILIITAIVCLVTITSATQLFWSLSPSKYMNMEIIKHALFCGYLMCQLLFIAMLLPIPNTVSALLVAGSYYSFTGILNLFFDNRLYGHTVKEYIYAWGFLLLLVTTSFIFS